MTATPIAPPACWVVDSTPEAAAACSGFTRASPIAGIGAITRPMPTPETTSPGMSQPAPSCSFAASSRYPADTISAPRASTCGPSRAAILPDCTEAAK